MGKATKSKRRSKAKHQSAKPYKEFPLTVHPSGRWCKKHKGTQYYFGKIEDGWEPALARFKREWEYIILGETPPAEIGSGAESDGLTIKELCNQFLNSKRARVGSGDLSERTFYEYQRTTDLIVDHFRKALRVDRLQPADFEKFRAKLADRYGTVGLRNTINTIRVIFKYAHDQRLIPDPVNYGQGFDRPSAKSVRRARNEAGPRLFEADELRRIIDFLSGVEVATGAKLEDGKPEVVAMARNPQLVAMLLLAANTGFGNSDLANLPKSAVDLSAGWVEFPRVKTEIQRRIPLWPATVEALSEAIECRPSPADRSDADCVFLTTSGNRWVRIQKSKSSEKPVPIDSLSQRFAKLLKRLRINGRKRLGFYTLRHNFQTIGGDAKDPDAVAAIMGHVDSSMGAVYRERIADDRLRAVVETVGAWLWPDENAKWQTT